MIDDKLGKYIRHKREEKGISLRGFAKQVGLSATMMSQFETGIFSSPGEDKIKNMSIVLGEDLDHLLSLAHRIPFDISAMITSLPATNIKKLRKYLEELSHD